MAGWLLQAEPAVKATGQLPGPFGRLPVRLTWSHLTSSGSPWADAIDWARLMDRAS